MAITEIAAVFLANTIRPALIQIGMWNPAAEELMLGTAVHESCGFKYRNQMGGGPALGYFQMEPATHNDIWTNYLSYRKSLASKVALLLSSPRADKLVELQLNDKYGAAMARLQYARAPEPLPLEGHLTDQALYWKRYYNTPLGAGTVTEYVNDWEKIVAGK